MHIDNRSQGQKIIYVTMHNLWTVRQKDVGPTVFRSKAALFRSTGHETRRLLRDVDDIISQESHEPEKKQEDDRHERFNEETQWDGG